MRKTVEELFRRNNLHIHKRTLHPFFHLLLALRHLLNPDRLRDNLLDGESRVERLERILKYYLHLLPQRLHLPPTQRRDVSTLEEYAAARGL